jgi:ribonuclease HII
MNQKTIIDGDAKEPIIALASICAKVLRDRKMKRLAKKYPGYGFEVHKGYGTKAHYRAIKKNGLSDIHRRSFLKNT